MTLGKTIQKYQTLIAVILIVGVIYYVATNTQIIQNFTNNLPQGFTPNVNVNLPQNSNSPAGNSLAPTSITAQVNPNPANMGGAVYAVATSNGYNIPMTVYARHTGADEWTNTETQSFSALIGPDGKYTHIQQINVPGYWEFWVTCGAVTSNVATLTVNGVLVTSDVTVTSGSAIFTVFSNYKNTAVSLIANDEVHGVSIPLQTGNTDSTGSISLMYNFALFEPGFYEIDALIGGAKASDFGGSVTLEVT